jgi:GntR family transcriptional regulator
LSVSLKPLKKAKVSLPLQTQQYLENLIKDGTYQPGEQLPSQEQLAEQLGISRATLREALQKLEIEGVIQRRHGVGTFVAPNYRQRLDTGLEVLESLEQVASKSGRQVKMSMLQVDICPAQPADQERLGLSSDAEILRVSRVMLLNDRPVAHLIDILPTRYLNETDLQHDFTGSVLDVLLRLGRPLSYSYTMIETVAASKDLADALRVYRKAPLLKFEARLYEQDGQVVDFSVSHFVPGHFNFHVVRRIGN